MIDLKELKKLADAAIAANPEPVHLINKDADALFMNAATPQTILDLLAHIQQQEERIKELEEAKRRLEVLDKLFWLAAEDIVFFSSYNTAIGDWDDDWHPAVNVSDTFFYASADAESLKDEEIDSLIQLLKQFGMDGVVAWSANKRGMEPLQQLKTEKYLEARAAMAAQSKEQG
jgi:hypothetical protein